MKILQVYHSMGIGGVGSYLLNVCSGLSARGHRVLLAAPHGELTPRFQAAGVECLNVPIVWRMFSARAELLRIIREEGVDLVCAHDHRAGPPAYLATRRTKTPYLLGIYCLRPWWVRPLMFHWSPRVVTITPGLGDSLVKDLGLARERVIETIVGVDMTRFTPAPAMAAVRERLGLTGEAPVVLHVCRLSSTKSNVSLALIQAASRLVREVPEVGILIAGTGEHEGKVRAAAKRMNTSLGRQTVRVLGAYDDVSELMRQARVVVGTGTVVQEAMASGCPVVAAGKFGFIGAVNPANFSRAWAANFGDHISSEPITPDAIAGALLPLLRHEDLCVELGKWGRRVATEQFSLERMTDHIEGIYADTISAGKGAPALAS